VFYWTVIAESKRVSLLGTAGSTICLLRTIWNCLHLLNEAFNMHSIGFLLHATKREWKSAQKDGGIAIFQKPKTVHACQWAASWQYTAAGGDVQVPWGGFHKWRKAQQGDTRICKANAVLHQPYRSVVTKLKLSNTAKLSVFKSVFVPIIIYGHEIFVMAIRVLSQVQGAEMWFLRKILLLGAFLVWSQ